ncbi:hypothetical protein DFS34DRAFT_646659 [Phlyctochytrium arcticum]|nr:hypothetical protein DFS34DRAFT_646659 [Phlyctochytrium arcticum]
MDTLDSLTDEQRETLQTFQAVTNQEDIALAVSTLDRNGWDLQRSIHGVLDGTAAASGQGHGDIDDAMNAASGSSSSESNLQVNSPSEAWRDVRPTTLWDLVALPITLPARIAHLILSYLASFLPAALRPSFLTRPTHRRPATSDNRAAAARFLLKFEETYGNTHPYFFQGTYSQALAKAKRDLGYVIVYLHSGAHDDTDTFCRSTLASDDLKSFIQSRNITVWAGDIEESEGYEVSNLLSATGFPFLAIIAPDNNRMSTIERLEGNTSAETLMSMVATVIEVVDPQLAESRSERREREQARSIREQQDEAYQASLRADREKERKAREERDRQKREEEAAQEAERAHQALLDAKRQQKQSLIDSLPSEPPASASDLAKLSLRLPSGERLIRRFLADDTMQVVYNFVQTRDLDPLDLLAEISVVNTYPRKEYLDMTQTLRDAGLVPNASLIVEERIMVDDDNSDE